MRRIFCLTADLASMGEDDDLPEGPLVVELRCTGQDEIGADWVFLASRDGGQRWREYHTVIEDTLA